MCQDVRAAVQEHLAAFNAHDTERVLAGFADDAVWVTGRDTARGRVKTFPSIPAEPSVLSHTYNPGWISGVRPGGRHVGESGVGR